MGAPISLPSSAAFQVTSAILDQHTLNGLVELYYLRVGNEVMASTMLKLETALQGTQGSLNVLSGLQNLHNSIGFTSMIPISHYFNFSASQQTLQGAIGSTQYVFHVSNSDSYQSAYLKIASLLYGRPVSPTMEITMPGGGAPVIIDAQASNVLVQSDFAQERAAIAYITSQLKAEATALQSIINILTPITPSNDPTTLLYQLKTVQRDLPSVYNFSSIKKWLMDGYAAGQTVGVNSGIIQQHITSAITAAQSLNSSQSANIRNYMFIFQQYYQSAASVLSQTNQQMLDIARKISG